MTPGGPGNPKHSVSVAAVISDDDGRVLLIRRADNGHWEPPGGVLELGETIETGLRRELREETGLDVEPLALTGVYKNMAQGVIALVFRAKVTGGQLRVSHETSAYLWATPAETGELTSETFAQRVADALTWDGRAAIRAHDGVRTI